MIILTVKVKVMITELDLTVNVKHNTQGLPARLKLERCQINFSDITQPLVLLLLQGSCVRALQHDFSSDTSTGWSQEVDSSDLYKLGELVSQSS